MVGDLMLQLRDTMSLIKADLGSVCVRVRSYFGIAQTPQQSHPLSPLHEPLHGELNAIRKQKCFLCSPLYGRACRWAMVGEIKPKGPDGITTDGSAGTHGLTPIESVA